MTNHRIFNCLASLLLLVCAEPAVAQFVVSKTADTDDGLCDADCSLREAFEASIADPGDNTITFSPSANGTIQLASPLPDYVSPAAMAIRGNGAALTRIRGGDMIYGFRVWSSASFTLRDLTVEGTDGFNHQGGALYANDAAILIEDVHFIGNYAKFDGGAVYGTESQVVINRCTFSGNEAFARGGAIDIHSGTLDATNVTVSGNRSQLGAGITLEGTVVATLTSATIVANSALEIEGYTPLGSGIFLFWDTPSLTLVNTIVAHNSTRGISIGGGSINLVDSHNNLLDPPSAGFVHGVNGNMVVAPSDQPMSTLGDFGGNTPTHALIPGNPAVDAGTSTGVPTSDQRGLPRVSAPDIGAFESRGFALTYVAGSSQATYVEHPFAQPLRVHVAAQSPSEPVEGGFVRFTAPDTGASAFATTASAVIPASGDAETTISANSIVGGPYNVAATLPGTVPAIDFSLTNKPLPGVIADPVNGLTTSESGATATFTVVLASPPDANVDLTIAVSDPSEASVSPMALGFTPSNWNVPQTVTLTGVDDLSFDGNIEYSLLLGPVLSDDPEYAGIEADPVMASNSDDDINTLEDSTGTDSGTARIDIVGGQCALDPAQTGFTTTQDLQLPENVAFPHGAVRIAVQGCDPGSSVTLRLTLPSLPQDTLWRLHALDPATRVTDSPVTGATQLTYNIVDGGAFDQDGFADGFVTDIVALGVSAADLAIEIDQDAGVNYPGDFVAFDLQVDNAGPQSAAAAVVDWNVPAGLVDVSWRCEAQGASTCTAEGTDAIDDTVTLPSNGSIRYLVDARVGTDAPPVLPGIAAVTTSADQIDPNPGNDETAFVLRIDGIFRDQLENEMLP